MGDEFDFTTTDAFRSGIPTRRRAARRPAAPAQMSVENVRKRILHAAKYFRDSRNPNEFNYAKLEPGEIRLLSVKPGKPDEQLFVVMFKAKLSQVENAYEALSYTWGEAPKVHHSIWVDDKNPPKARPKQTNFFQDLGRTVRSHDKSKKPKRSEALDFDERLAITKEEKDRIAKRREQLKRLDELAKEKTALVGVCNTEADRAKSQKLAAEIKAIEEEYDKQYPVDLGDELDIHYDRLSGRLEDTYRAQRMAAGTDARFTASSAQPSAATTYPNQTSTELQRFYVRPNLYAALTHLRDRSKPINLWVDAICINQQTDGQEEKSDQLTRMASIFGTASNVAIWLGESDMVSHAALTLVGRMLDFTQLDNLVAKLKHAGSKAHSESVRTKTEGLDSGQLDGDEQYRAREAKREIGSAHWYDLIELLRRPWFSRRWIIQEIGVAKHATVHIGDQVEHWDNLADAITLLNDKADELRSRSRFHDSFDDIEGLSASFLVKVITNACRRDADGSVTLKLMKLETLVCSLLAFDSFFPKDCIFSVLSLAADWPNESDNDPDFHLRPDYKRSITDTLIAFVRRSILTSRSLDIICRHWAPPSRTNKLDKEIELPSWISTVDKTLYGRPSSFHGRQYGENLVGFKNGDTRRRYNASHGTTPKFEIAKLDKPKPQPTVESIPEETVRTPVSSTFVASPSTQQSPDQPISRTMSASPELVPSHETPNTPPDTPARPKAGTDSNKQAVPEQNGHLERSSTPKTRSNEVPPGKANTSQSNAGSTPPQGNRRSSINTKPPVTRPKPQHMTGRPPLSQTVSTESLPPNSKNNPAKATVRRKGTTLEETKDKLSRTLKVEGFILGTVDETSGTMKDDIEGHWVEKLGWNSASRTENNVPEVLWQTLVAGRDDEGATAPTWYRRACLHALSDPKVTDGQSFIRVGQAAIRSSPLDEYTRRYLRRVSQVMMKRKIFVGSSNSGDGNMLYGLAPEGTKPGDVICILFGCSVPVILHKITDKGYLLIGEAFVHGKMEGEAMSDWEKGGVQTEHFEIN